MKPIIGSHHSIREDAHLWHFVRTSPRGSPPFAKEPNGFLIIIACIASGLVTAVLAIAAAVWLIR